MNQALKELVRDRAKRRCEYCTYPEQLSDFPFVVDHIIAIQHGGPSDAGNLALACGFCNLHKGPSIAGIDPLRGQLTRLFHPRIDRWEAHFRIESADFVGITDIGRATIAVLAINHPEQVAIRRALIDEGMF